MTVIDKDFTRISSLEYPSPVVLSSDEWDDGESVVLKAGLFEEIEKNKRGGDEVWLLCTASNSIALLAIGTIDRQ